MNSTTIPKVRASTGYTSVCLWTTNMILTFVFFVFHLFIMIIFFKIQSSGNWLALLWSILQLIVGVYSLGLTFGEVVVQIVFLYGRYIAKMLIFFYLSLGMVMIVVSITNYLSAQTVNEIQSSLYTIFYSIGMNLPSIPFMITLSCYITDVDLYM